MYVTDVPVIDRMTDPTWRELWPAFQAVEEALTNLAITAEDVPAAVEHARGCGEDCANLAAHLEGLSEATDGAWEAQNYMAEALALVGIEPL